MRTPTIQSEFKSAMLAMFLQGRYQRYVADRRLWPWHRSTGWRIVKQTMSHADLDGVCASPRGLRHSLAIAALQANIPETFVHRWLGHARLSTTAIYTAAEGEEEIKIAKWLWINAQ